MKSNVVNIKIKKINGINHPNLTIEGNLASKEDQFLLYVDGVESPFDFQIYPKSNQFVLNSELTKKNKQVILKLKHENEIIEVAKLKNWTMIRMKNKFVYLIKKPFTKLRVLCSTLKRGITYFWREYHFLVPPSLWGKYWREFLARIKVKDANSFYNPFHVAEYNKWLKQNETFSEVQELSYNPSISLLIPVYNIGRKFLSECIDSILNQTYQNFELILVDDCSTKEETIETLKEYEKKDSRIVVKYRKKNGHISAATNDALKLATGEFVGLVDNDDILAENALYEVVKVLNENKKLDMIYSDEDKINLKGERCDPNFKSDFAPDSLLSSNYICHFTVLRKSIMDKIGGFRLGYEGAQDYDLFLRFTEQTKNIYHIPKILYHWRMVEGSTSMVIDNKSYALEKGKMALEDALKRRKIKGSVQVCESCPYYQITYDIPKNAKVSIIIPTKDHADITENCLKSIYEKTTYSNFEIIMVNNNSTEPKSFALFEKYQKEHDNFQVIDANFEFNYSKINNLAVKKATGDYILLLYNDIEVITKDWLEKMLGYASQKHIGAVGVKLLYPDETVQHGGVVLGLGGVAAHVFLNAPKDAVVWGGRLSVPYNYSAVTAACLMIERKKWNEVKGLEESLKVAFNDVDFNLKLLKKGYYNVFLPQVELYHHESKSRGLDNTPEKYKRFVGEVNYMTTKWETELTNDPFYNPNYSLLKEYVLDKKSEKRK